MKRLFILLLFSSLFANSDKNPDHVIFEPYKVGVSQHNGKACFEYRIRFKNFPKGQKYRVSTENLRGREGSIAFQVNEKGKPIEISKDKIDINMRIFGLQNLHFSEPIFFCLESFDGKTQIEKIVIPKPIEAIGKDNAKISIMLLSSTLDLFVMKCEGFKKNEKVKLIGTSCHEKMEHCFEIASDPLIVSSSPAVIGKTGGIASYTIKRKNEELKIIYPWGDKMRGYSPHK